MTDTAKLTAIDPRLADRRQLSALLAIVARLRDPEHGCPWDLKQTFASILPYTLEEAYEVAESIELDDMAELREELGDLLFQVAVYARMAEEEGHFEFADVVESITEKMIRRHPHVFGEADFSSEAEARASWEAIKAAERRAKGEREHISVLEGVAQALPALVRAEKLQKRAAHVGFDWDELDGVVEKVREELRECEEAIAEGDNFNARVHEVGDLLFSCVNLARHLDVDAEQALRAANHRFERRFHRVEVCLRAAGLSPSRDQRERMERLWETVKHEER
ncbi:MULTISPECIES: nucleoside triphosphate pyrophosphohydrolase [Thiorhodovibrio]|uniref:nucleoside triphosphate pyrophosphohydrolase n=1 Tax=Thiorhodovibrio TaxID=61593 RepID=UPI001914758C|nr:MULTISPECIES: nucleoside triphosphate pyrophosphohydrolase [Thiorhodovibrio]MBK5967388.1 nucleoside triphosphate pyrophosphohydrolase [Thiorhodovibrio winogradskyi]WPL10393.1 Nucleoside triphosphate pyrophosphohydrolase [Thiorhodovibrio litoralis]